MKKRTAGIVFIFGLFSLCPMSVCADYKFRVGVNLPLSGMAQEFGVAIRNGIALAQLEKPDEFASIGFDYQDSRYDPKVSISAFNKQKLDRVDLIFVWGNTPSQAIAPLVERAKIPTIAALTEHADVKDFHYLIRFLNSNDQFSKTLLEYLRSKNIKNIAVAMADQSYYHTYYDGIVSNLKDDERVTLLNTYVPEVMDFKDAVLKLKKEKYDILGLFLVPGQISTMARQMNDLGVKLPVFGADDFESNSEVEQSKGMLEGGVYAGNPVTESFHKRYLKEYDNDTHIFYAANAYDFACLVVKLFGKLSDKPDAEEVLKDFQGVARYDGAAGAFSFRDDAEHGKYFEFPIVVKKIVGMDREQVYPASK